LNDAFTYEEFDDFFFKNIDNYSKPEWDAMEEAFTRDADGDLIMVDELDDKTLTNNNYSLNAIFIEDNESELISKLDKELSQAKINSHTNMVLQKLPIKMQIVFNLKTIGHFKPKEIAQIKRMHLSQVNQVLTDTQNALKISFRRRFIDE
tara:strand:- start:694 stop:1143 length:450 start_codon:yes stop_codon:yes gene_type:complete